MALSKELLEIIACPECKGVLELDQNQAALVCPACCLRYPVRDGIPVMLADEAEKFGE